MAKPTPVELAIERLSKSGDGVADHQGRTVFVEGALPGERVLAQIEDRGKALHGVVERWKTRSKARREPACALAEVCGGCSWLHLDEAAQRAAKEEIVTSTLEHLGAIKRDAYALEPTIFGAQQMGYRRRAAMHPVDGGLGFNGRRSHSRVRVDHCPALVPELESIAARIPADGLEEVRFVSDRGIGVSFHVAGLVKPALRKRAEQLLREGVADCVVLVPESGQPEVFGKTRPRADAFIQTNADVNEKMAARVAELLAAPGRKVLELYAGSGNLTRAVGGVASLTAVESARVTQPKLENVRWVQGDTEKVVKGFIAEHVHFERLLLDPPRAGAVGVGRWAEALKVERVIYVACDPASLARDAAELRARGFKPQTLQLFDMFPQTHHVEAVMSFVRA